MYLLLSLSVTIETFCDNGYQNVYTKYTDIDLIYHYFPCVTFWSTVSAYSNTITSLNNMILKLHIFNIRYIMFVTVYFIFFAQCEIT